MANLVLAKMLFATAVSGGTNGGNLMTPDPKEVATATGGSTSFDLDFGVATSFHTFFAGFISSGVRATTGQTATGLGTGLGSTTGLVLGPTTESRRHALLKAG